MSSPDFRADPGAKPPIYENSLLGNFAVGGADPPKCALRCCVRSDLHPGDLLGAMFSPPLCEPLLRAIRP
ncbi:MAG: hypothetical protein RMJ19_04070, partial [Gemmatales bacterium]|nr:hypothetical protein [Gemmatales bacterium]MDW8174823.1 hypothetical protein [Gemmatales bacterium]